MNTISATITAITDKLLPYMKLNESMYNTYKTNAEVFIYYSAPYYEERAKDCRAVFNLMAPSSLLSALNMIGVIIFKAKHGIMSESDLEMITYSCEENYMLANIIISLLMSMVDGHHYKTLYESVMPHIKPYNLNPVGFHLLCTKLYDSHPDIFQCYISTHVDEKLKI
jgi:hypothetical protein